ELSTIAIALSFRRQDKPQRHREGRNWKAETSEGSSAFQFLPSLCLCGLSLKDRNDHGSGTSLSVNGMSMVVGRRPEKISLTASWSLASRRVYSCMWVYPLSLAR